MVATRLLINLTRGPDDPDRATVAFVMANSGLALDKEVVVLLSTDGANMATPDAVAGIAEEGFMKLSELVSNFLAGGGQIWACTPCVKKRHLEDRLMSDIKLVGAVSAIEWVADNGTSLSF